jgi:hypothetical protein
MHAPNKKTSAKIVRKTVLRAFSDRSQAKRKLTMEIRKKMFGAVALSYAGIGHLYGITAPATKASCSRYFR